MNFVVTTEYNWIADWMLLIIAMKLIQYPSLLLMRLSTCSQCLKYQTYMLMLQQRKPDKHNCCIALQTVNSVWTGVRLTSQNWSFLIHINSIRATQIHYFWLVFCFCEKQPACVSPVPRVDWGSFAGEALQLHSCKIFTHMGSICGHLLQDPELSQTTTESIGPM